MGRNKVPRGSAKIGNIANIDQFADKIYGAHSGLNYDVAAQAAKLKDGEAFLVSEVDSKRLAVSIHSSMTSYCRTNGIPHIRVKTKRISTTELLIYRSEEGGRAYRRHDKIPRKEGRGGLELEGLTFGKLTARELIGKKSRFNLWRCDCACGGTREVTSTDLVTNKIRCCGCTVDNGRVLTPDQVRDIRELLKQGGSIRSVAMAYSVGKNVIHGISTGKTYKDVE